ncbi:MAG: hypothetical protein AAGJ46_16035 [Planctomycetota bacterium]
MTANRRKQHGTVYVAVLGISMIVAMMALAGATVGRLELRRSASRSDAIMARILAQEAIEFGFNWMDKNPNWRTELTNGIAHGPFHASGGGNFRFVATDPDGDLADDAEEGFVLRGVGRSGDAVACEEVEVAFTGEPLDCLLSALTVNSAVSMPNGSLFAWKTIYGDGIVSVNGNLATGSSYSKVDCDAWATGTITGDIEGFADELQSPARQMPGANVFDYYIANGTPIEITAIPESSGKRRIIRRLISPAANPYGPANPNGIYVIDCQGEDLVIHIARIVGTIVLLNNGDGSEISNAMCWEPAEAGMPALLVENNIKLNIAANGLIESVDNVNYNPPGTPYEGETDNDESDLYSPRMWGIIYCGGRLTVDQYFGFVTKGAVVCEEYELDSIVTHNYDAVHLNNPPPGFRNDGELRIVPGSWRSVAY